MASELKKLSAALGLANPETSENGSAANVGSETGGRDGQRRPDVERIKVEYSRMLGMFEALCAETKRKEEEVKRLDLERVRAQAEMEALKACVFLATQNAVSKGLGSTDTTTNFLDCLSTSAASQSVSATCSTATVSTSGLFFALCLVAFKTQNIGVT